MCSLPLRKDLGLLRCPACVRRDQRPRVFDDLGVLDIRGMVRTEQIPIVLD